MIKLFRDYLAMKAMVQLIKSKPEANHKYIAEDAYSLANEMLKARGK